MAVIVGEPPAPPIRNEVVMAIVQKLESFQRFDALPYHSYPCMERCFPSNDAWSMSGQRGSSTVRHDLLAPPPGANPQRDPYPHLLDPFEPLLQRLWENGQHRRAVLWEA